MTKAELAIALGKKPGGRVAAKVRNASRLESQFSFSPARFFTAYLLGRLLIRWR